MLTLCLVGSRWFGASVFEALRRESGVQIAQVVAIAADDRLALAAAAAGVPVHVLANPKVVPAEAVPDGCGLIVAAHTHARVSNEALARSKLGGVGYHPSLLPRHRGIAAVEWTLLEGDPIAGGSVYHLADGWDAGAVAAQDWCFVARDDTARTLWERELAPMGLRLLAQVARQARDSGALPSKTQDSRFATRAPMLRKAVLLDEGAGTANTALVVTVVGRDRPGIVRALSERAARHGANWAASRMERVAGEFAGMVHFEVARENAHALAEALRALEPSAEGHGRHQRRRAHAARRLARLRPRTGGRRPAGHRGRPDAGAGRARHHDREPAHRDAAHGVVGAGALQGRRACAGAGGRGRRRAACRPGRAGAVADGRRGAGRARVRLKTRNRAVTRGATG
jgi:methionyl-tRNA formyltransferase